MTLILPRDVYYETLGAAIKRARKEHGWTQGQLGVHLGVSSVAVCRWESGQDAPDAWTVERIERLMGRVRP